MKKSLILIAMAMIVMLCGAAGAGEIPENLLPTDPRLEGLVREALPLEDGLVVLDYGEEWSQVEFEGFHGFMMTDYLKKPM